MRAGSDASSIRRPSPFPSIRRLGRDVHRRAATSSLRPASAVADGMPAFEAFSHLEGVMVGDRAQSLGRFARLRPGTVHGRRRACRQLRRGQGVDPWPQGRQSQSSELHRGCRPSVRKTNIGAGTITCNYNGFQKFKDASSVVGDVVFVGSDSASRGRPGDDRRWRLYRHRIGGHRRCGGGCPCVIARARQVEKPGWAKTRFRAHSRARGKKRGQSRISKGLISCAASSASSAVSRSRSGLSRR